MDVATFVEICVTEDELSGPDIIADIIRDEPDYGVQLIRNTLAELRTILEFAATVKPDFHHAVWGRKKTYAQETELMRSFLSEVEYELIILISSYSTIQLRLKDALNAMAEEGVRIPEDLMVPLLPHVTY